MNIGNITNKFEDLKLDPMIRYAEVICLSETWLVPEDDNSPYRDYLKPRTHKHEYELHVASKGKGIATYVKNGILQHKKKYN